MSSSRSNGILVTALLAMAFMVGGVVVRQQADRPLVGQSPKDLIAAAKGSYGDLDEVSYFDQVAALLRDNYVEPVEINQKMASGAVRGMINSLLDPSSQFYDADQLKVFLANQRGIYDGVGAEIELRFNQSELKKLQGNQGGVDSLLLLPEIYIASVMPGSPAEKAGLKAGDEIRKVGERYIITGRDVKKLRDMQTLVTEKKASTEELTNLRNKMQVWVEHNIPASKVREELMTGTSGDIQILVRDPQGKERTVAMPKSQTQIPAVIPGVDTQIRLFAGLSQKLKLEDGATIDLRNSGSGDYNEIEKVLPQFLSPGEYGFIYQSGDTNRPINVKQGSTPRANLTIIVDESTHGAAALLANIIAESGQVKVEGKLPTPGPWIEVHTLPDQSGYTLSSGTFTKAPVKTASNLKPSEEAR